MIKKNFLCLFFLHILFNFANAEIEKELPFVFVICSYNNAKWVYKNLDSVFNQIYKNFRVIYIDDASTDGTADMVENYIQKHHLEEKITLIKNTQRARKLKNIYHAYHLCQNFELIAQLDGDDWLPHENVLSLLNTIFSTHDIWFSYGQFMHSTGVLGFCCDIPLFKKQRALFRKEPFVTAHLKVFYAWLFKMVKLEDLIVENVPGWQGQFYPAANDCATIFPMLDMAREHIRFNKEVIYVFNRENPISGHVSETKLQNACTLEVRSLPIYPKLENPVINRLKTVESETADCIIISDNPDLLTIHLKNTVPLLKGVKKINVIFQAHTTEDKDHYIKLKQSYPNLNFYDPRTWSSTGILSLESNYILCINEKIILSDSLDCTKWIRDIEKTFAYCCCGILTKADFKEFEIPFQHIENNLYAWKFLCDEKLMLNPHNFNLSLYRKKHFMKALKDKTFQNIEQVIDSWACTKMKKRKIGLFFDL
jgi:glycosyltransferase involved in cell wall biosynthesis